MSDEIADVLADGREYLEKNGWWRGRLLGPNGRQACALGGLLFSQQLGECDLNSPRGVKVRLAMVTLAAQIRKIWNGEPANPYCTPPDCDSDVITHWNDFFADKQEVLDVMAKAEKIERNQGVDPDE
jgi:hypothetical protein